MPCSRRQMRFQMPSKQAPPFCIPCLTCLLKSGLSPLAVHHTSVEHCSRCLQLQHPIKRHKTEQNWKKHKTTNKPAHAVMFIFFHFGLFALCLIDAIPAAELGLGRKLYDDQTRSDGREKSKELPRIPCCEEWSHFQLLKAV